MNNLWKIFVVLASLGVALFLGSQAFAATSRAVPGGAICEADYTTITDQLETPEIAEELVDNIEVVSPDGRAFQALVYANATTGTYSIIAINPDSKAGCFVGMGRDWKPGDVVGLHGSDPA
jgi:hypothetical protein